MSLAILTRSHGLFSQAETLIGDVFTREYGATVDHLPDRILVVLGVDDELLCAAGLRDSASGIFSECYLDVPAETAIEGRVGQPVRREQILELTALAAARPGAMAALLQGFASLGLEAGYRWGLFTATKRLRRMARRIGIDLIELSEARRDRISDPENWGSYYDQQPVVCAVEGKSAQGHLKSGFLNSCGTKQSLSAR
ncbi:MAG: hypothetical protein HOK21_24285 [Rhodospirillaceae bacterium]|jgi:hypothetical protein|nr:hypothetical protein [Rhodospirillaceae bacterium]MBT4044714.1 hypothetical protein [Rhodospirillaceae bacterium]MBT5083510.1 hypothetical protein [Rhodospirillaceae bacterium]MBT5527219.1 hypothetical protein [Rhodospirillaceae bacterium]MBT5879944.1 hypothetical protein [Rhodospirillaceae bacterium]